MFQVLNGVNRWAAFLMFLLYSCINYCNFIWDLRQYFVLFLLLFIFIVFQVLFILHASLAILQAFPSLHIWSSCHWVGSCWAIERIKSYIYSNGQKTDSHFILSSLHLSLNVTSLSLFLCGSLLWHRKFFFKFSSTCCTGECCTFLLFLLWFDIFYSSSNGLLWSNLKGELTLKAYLNSSL